MEIYTIQSPLVLEPLERNGYYRPSPELCLDATEPCANYRLSYRWMIDRLCERCGFPYGIDQEKYRHAAENDGVMLSGKWKENTTDDFCALVPPASNMPHPVWGWAKRYDRDDGKVDMRSYTTVQQEEVIRLKLQIPSERLLLSDFDYWHIPLNLGYIPKYDENGNWEDDDNRFELMCRKAGLTRGSVELFSRETMKTLQEKKNPEIIHLQDELINSWNRCLLTAEQTNDIAAGKKYSFREIPWKNREIQCVFWEIKAEDVISCENFITRKAAEN